MTDDLVKRLREMQDWTFAPCREAADRIEKLEALVEQLRDDNSSLIDSFDKDFLRQEAHIKKLEAALRKIKDLHHGPEDDDVIWIRDDMTYKIVCDTLEGK